MASKKPKGQKAWAVVDKDGVIMDTYRSRKLARGDRQTDERVVPVTVTIGH